MTETYCIIGAGTYGCYLANALSQKFPEATIYLIDAGGKTIQSESEIGFASSLTHGNYNAASAGRYFGLGGTSAKWGGQLLFFSKDDFANCPQMQAVVTNNEAYKNKVLQRFFDEPPRLQERELDNGAVVKQGIWLKFQKRNLFSTFKIDKKKNIHIIPHYRVTRILCSDGKVSGIVIRNKTETKEIKAGQYYITAGALESLRLLMVSGIKNIEAESASFSDHISLRCFEILSDSANIGPVDFRFRFKQGSMLTSRITGEIDDISYYAHPIFNESFILFQLLKEIIFKGRFSIAKSVSAAKQILSFFPFLYRYVVKKDLFIYKSWFLNIDVELSESENIIRLSQQKDEFDEAGIDITFQITESTLDKLNVARVTIKKMLIENQISFKEVNANATTTKVEDVYHPYGLFQYKDGDTIWDVYNPIGNLFMFNTGLLARAGAINPTASLFCLIEEHVDNL